MLLLYCFAVVSTIQIISAQEPPPGPLQIPPECMKPPQGIERHPATCCHIPTLVSDAELQQCGIDKARKSLVEPPSCENLNCIFKAHQALTPDGQVDLNGLNKHFDEWVKKNPTWASASSIARERCFGKNLPGPPQACEAQKLIFCVNDSFMRNCVDWEQSPDCKVIKDHATHCDRLLQQQP